MLEAKLDPQAGQILMRELTQLVSYCRKRQLRLQEMARDLEASEARRRELAFVDPPSEGAF